MGKTKKSEKHSRDSEQEARDVEKETRVLAKEADELYDLRSRLRKAASEKGGLVSGCVSKAPAPSTLTYSAKKK